MTRPIKLALGLSAALITWMAAGPLLRINVNAPQAAMQHTLSPQKMRVVVVQSKAQRIEPLIVANGQTAPSKETTLKAEIIGVVDKVLKREGAHVKKGELLVSLKLSDKMARLNQAKAKVIDEEKTLQAMQRLRPQGYSAETKYYDAKTELAKARALLLAVQIELSKTRIIAPFDGIISELIVEEGDYLKAGNKIGFIVNNTPLMVEVGIAQTDINQIKPGATSSIHLATGETLIGNVCFISPKADPATRMFKIEIRVPNPKHLRAGISTEATISAPTILTHFISPALLSININGIIGVKTIDKKSIVHFVPVNIVRANSKGLWLSGLKNTVTLISTGQGFVEDGESVIAVEENKATSQS